VVCRWFSLDTPVSSTNKTDSHDKTEILLKLALNTITFSYLRLLITHSWKLFLLNVVYFAAFGRSLFVLLSIFLVGIALSVLRFTSSVYLFWYLQTL
jgi:hypothetical protein